MVEGGIRSQDLLDVSIVLNAARHGDKLKEVGIKNEVYLQINSKLSKSKNADLTPISSA